MNKKRHSPTDLLFTEFNKVNTNIGKSSPLGKANHREKILRDLIKKNYMPSANRAICKGHCVNLHREKSKEIDILIWDTHFNPRYNDVDSEYNNVTPESVRAIIEVKTDKKDFTKGLMHVLKVGSFINKNIQTKNFASSSNDGEDDKLPPIFAGVFIYKGYKEYNEEYLKSLFENDKFKQFWSSLDLHNAPIIVYCVIGKNILAKLTKLTVLIYEFPNESIDIFLNLLGFWLEETESYNLGSDYGVRDILTTKPIFKIALANPLLG